MEKGLTKMTNENQCVCCGAPIPEGSQVCYNCVKNTEEKSMAENVTVGWGTNADASSQEPKDTISCLCDPIDMGGNLKEQFILKISDSLRSWLGSKGTETAQNVISYLESTDFFTAPASTKYHENYKGGLLEHSCKVGNIAIGLMDAEPFCKEPMSYSQVWLTALLHDLCKTNFYELYEKSVKNESTGKWEKVPAYRVRDGRDTFLGHGEYSAILAAKLIPDITIPMLEAIRWHMGLWDCSDSGTRDYSAACSRHPLVHLIQFADLLSCAGWVKF